MPAYLDDTQPPEGNATTAGVRTNATRTNEWIDEFQTHFSNVDQSINQMLASIPATPRINTDQCLVPDSSNGYNYQGKGGGEFTAQAGRIVWTPFVQFVQWKMRYLGATISTTSATGLFRIGIYNCGNDGWPESLWYDTGDLSAATAGFINHDFGSEAILPAGKYWAASVASDTTLQAWGLRYGTSPNPGVTRTPFLLNASAYNPQFYKNAAYGPLPATFPGYDGTTAWAVLGLCYA